MNPNREELLFQLALMKPASERVAFLDRECGDDKALRARIEALLAAHEQSEGMLAEPAPAAKATMKLELADTPDESIGQVIGRYKVLQKIGEGGCGAVYMAEQTEPVRRRVALKVIKLGMDTKAVVARFEAERQALAMMDHPNIAKVLDAGATETGRPYFVMELVRGIKFTEYCDQNHLDTRTRLELFIQICQAIQHAHQKGIIHRDIKPSNILVTLHDGIPVPKVIDFGIAKATTGQQLTDKTLFTAYEQFIGTPAYMSPEQAEMSGLDVDTRSDIYSLGVLLYELLTGRTPFDPRELMESGLDAMRKTIREKEPVKPSTKVHTLQGEELTTTAKRRGVDVPKLASQLRGDLDWIVMKCLEKDRTRRYETANGLAMDLKRHLNNETVVARPPSKLYEFQRTVRRHKVGFAATAAIIVVLAAGVVMTTWQAVRATQARASESIQRQKAEANEQKAVAAQKAEAEAELVARQRAYASDMNVAMQALNENNLEETQDLLNRQRPQPSQKDLRGWEWRYLWQQARSDALFTLCQINGEVHSLAASPDGRWLAVGAQHEGGVSVWDLQSRQEVAHLATNEDETCAAFSPTQPLLAFTGSEIPASGAPQPILRLWNTAARQMVAELPLDESCEGLAFSKDGRTLVTSTQHGHITLWRMPEGTKLASYPSEQDFVVGTGFAANADLSLAAYWSSGASIGARIHVVDLRTGKTLWTEVAGKEFITALAFSPDGKTLASAAGFGESDIRLWDVATGKETDRLEGHGSWVGSMVFWPDGKKLASASADQTIRIWDVATRKCLDVLRGSRSQVWQLMLLPDNKILVSGNKNGTVMFWDTSVTHPRQPCITVPAKVSAWCFAPDSQSVLTVDQQGQVAQWRGPDFQQAELLMTLPTGTGLGPLFSKDGRFLAAGSTKGIVQVWDVTRKVLRRQWTNSTGVIGSVQFLPGGDELLTLAETGHLIQEWDLTTGLELQSWAAPRNVNCGAVSPDGRMAAAAGDGGFLRNLSGQSGVNRSLDILEAGRAAFSPDGRLLVVTSHLGYFRLWNTASGQEEMTLTPAIHGVVFSPDGKRLATDTGAGVILWDTESWQNVLRLNGPGAGYVFESIAFSPDESIVGALNVVGTLDLWRAPSWADIHAAEAQ
ncbi:MAG TPA: protein kinase [Verrucomicrobiae bacterium]|nr:protein kinase [Verrucomicrobiae bacterium]